MVSIVDGTITMTTVRVKVQRDCGVDSSRLLWMLSVLDNMITNSMLQLTDSFDNLFIT
jgi:hypothetical protein